MRYAAAMIAGVMMPSVPAARRARRTRPVSARLRRGERRALASRERRPRTAGPVPARLAVVLVPVEGSDGGHQPRSPCSRLDMRGYNLSSRPESIERLWHAVLFYTAGGSKPRDKWHRRVRCKSSPDETRRPSKPGTQRPRALVLRCTSLRKA